MYMNLKPNKDKCIRDIKEHFFIFNKRCLSRFLRCVITNSNLHVRHWPNIQRLLSWINIFLPLSLPALMWVLSVPRPTSIDIKSSLISLKAVDCFIQARMFLESVPFRSFRSRQVFWCQFVSFRQRTVKCYSEDGFFLCYGDMSATISQYTEKLCFKVALVHLITIFQ